nr:unnamed protein product [Callosobruchus chinensis]
MELRLEKVIPIYDDFYKMQNQTEFHEDADEDEITRLESLYFEFTSSMQALCNKFKDASISGRSDSVRSVQSNQNNVESLVRLPPIKLPTFNGHYDSWLEFKDCFLALVHNNNSLTDIQRFNYLRSSLEVEVQQIIKSIEVSSDNYNVAWQMLEQRYENKKLIIHKHLKAIFDHPSISYESHIDLRNLYDSMTKHLRSLNSLGLETDTWDSIIIYIICLKLDATTRREWESRKNEHDLPNMNDMNDFLKEKCEMLEKLEVTSGGISGKGKIRNSSRSFASIQENSRLKCYFCGKEHPIYKCDPFLKLNVNDRVSAAKRLKLCLNCLRDSHPTWKCKLQKCIKCHKLHNSLLHLNPNSSAPTAGANAAVSQNQNGSKGDSPATTVTAAGGTGGESVDDCAAESNTFRATQGSGDVAASSQVAEVLLSTAMVRVINGSKSLVCRALLDSGLQSNFVTEKVCKTLGLECKRVNHVVKGVGDALSKLNKEVKVSLNSCQGDFTMKVSCLVIPSITGKLPVKSFGKNKLKLPSELKLADPNFNVSGDIDMLLGSGVFWSVSVPGRKRNDKNVPVLQNTEFGWVIADKWQSIQCLVQQLWSRWQLEYLNELQMRQKWKANCQQLLKVGSLVLVKDDKAPPLSGLLDVSPPYIQASTA